ncbi:telomere-associated protein RIF1-like isoform X1 [Lytechinus pictus]|uniref:telomere-associated protein RIF1-like isoform X1 n=1 Tax=Lytechinus pictus TaxID=7653 RepID=UPI0030B9B0E8
MMVTAATDVSQEVSSFQTVLGKLQGKQDGGSSEDRMVVYEAISNWFNNNDAARIKDSANIDVGVFVRQFSTDVMSEDTSMVQAALVAMGFCLNQSGILRAFTNEQCSLVVKALCNCLLKTDDKSLCTRALWCLAKQNIKPEIIKGEIHTILCSVEKAVQGEGSAKSLTVQHESIDVIIRLQEQLPEDMSHHAARWGKLLLPNLVHMAPKIRDRAIHATHLGLVAMVQARVELVGPLVADLKSVLLTEMVKLFRARNELSMLKVWTYYVTILGKTLHKGGSLINSLLTVIELGFKSPQPEVKKTAYRSWRALIDNFSLDLDVLSNAKRLKLLMQPFLATSIRFESVVHTKLDTWWYLVSSLGTRLPSTFQVVCAPLLQFTLGSIRTGSAGVVTPNKGGSAAPPFMQGFSTPQARTALLPATSPITPRLNLSLNGTGAQQTFASVQLRGVRMLAAILGIQEPSKAAKGASDTVDVLPQKLLSSPSVFSKVAPCLAPYVMDVLFLQDETIGDLPLRIFSEFVKQVGVVLEGSSKRDSVGVFALLTEHLTTVVNSNQLPPSTVLKLLDCVSQLPKKVLSSSSYHTGSAGVMHGTPALYLTSLLFNQTTVISKPEERFFSILIRLVECGMASPGTFLGFSQSVIATVDKVSDSVTSKEALWRMWSVLAGPLLQHIVQTNEVNQGDSLEHDFSAVIACLLFPIQRLITADLSQATVKTLLKLWSELYEAFARSASKVTIAEANQCCEDISSKLLTQVTGAALEKWYYIDAVSQVCQAITQNLDLSHYTVTTPGSPRHPGKRPKVKSRYQGNLASLVKLVACVTEACADLCKKQTTLFSPSLSQTDVVHWFSAAQSLIGAMSDCCRVGLPSYIHGILINWSKPLGHFMHFVASPNIAKKDYLSAIEDKLERLWIDLTTTVQNRYSKGFDTQFLNVMAPALEAAFTHKKRSLRNYTLVFWTSTFGNEDSLQYPDVLKPCLAKMKTIGEIALPGWSEKEDILSENAVIPETEDPDDVMAPPAPPVIPNFGGPSPQKMHGSFLHRLDDAKKLLEASSPVKGQITSPRRSRRIQTYSPGSAKRKQFASPLTTDAAKRRLHVDEDKNTAFVVISSEPKKKRVLTEHQKEVMRTKRVSLALYNGLDQSQDTQAFKDLTQTQSQSQTPSPIPTPEVEDLPDETKKFNFSGITEQTSDAKDEAEEEKKEENTKDTNGDDSLVVLPSSQQNTQKPARRVVTFFEPVKKMSSPIKDAGQILIEGGKHIEDASEDSSTGDIWSDAVQELPELVKESSVVIVEDTCQEESQEGLGLLSGGAVVEDEVKQRNAEFDVPETQDDTSKEVDVFDISDSLPVVVGDSPVKADSVKEVDVCDISDSLPVDVGESPVKDNVIPESCVESPVKDDNPAIAQKESPERDVPLDAEDLTDVLPDGRFKTVVSTPVIKLQKLSQQDIELYSPRAAKYSEGHTRKESPFKKPKDSKTSGGSEEGGTPRLRRYRSDEIHNRRGTPKSARRSYSLSEVSSPKSKDSPSKTVTDLNSLQASQQDLAELAERYELDGIAPLGDDLDQSIEECLRNLNDQDADTIDDLPAVDFGQTQKDDEVRPDLERIEDHVVDQAMPDEDIICSQQELFSSMDESMDETVIEVKPQLLDEEAEKDVDKVERSEEGSPEKSSARRGRPRKSESNKDDFARSQELNEEENSQDSTCANIVNVEQVKRRRRSKLSQNSENEIHESQEKENVEVKDTARRRRRSRKIDDGDESQALEKEDKEKEIKSQRGRSQKTQDSQPDTAPSLEDAEVTKSEKRKQRSRRGEEKISSLDNDSQESDSEVQDIQRNSGKSRKMDENEVHNQKEGNENGTKGRKRRHLRSKVKEVSQEHQSEVPKRQKENSSGRLAADSGLFDGKQQEDKNKEQKEVILKDQKEVLPEAELAAPTHVTEPAADSSSEDLFGTCPSDGQSEALPKVGEDSKDSQLDDSISSEDDDIPLVQIKASLQTKADLDIPQSHVRDTSNSSEDSEVDFPILTPSTKGDKVSPTTETPPRDQLAEMLTKIKEKDTPKHSLSAVKGEEVLTVTRSGRKCRPSAKIRCAKDILRKALNSPEGRHKVIKSTAVEVLKSPKRISPKALRSMAKKLAAKETSPSSGKERHKRRSSSPKKQDISETEKAAVNTSVNLSNEDVLSYAISPKSLKVLAEKVAQDMSPEQMLSPPKVMSERKPHSPKTSALTSSQILRNTRSGKVSKRSKSPVSRRLRSKMLILSPGPVKTRSGTKLSRMEIKKRNKKQKASKEPLDQSHDEEGIEDIVDSEQPKEESDHEVDEDMTNQGEEVIVIKDTMSQEIDEDSTQVEVKEGLDNKTEQTTDMESKDSGNKENKCIIPVDAVIKDSAVDEDGDIEMKDLEQMMSQDVEVPEALDDVPDQVLQESEHVDEIENKIAKQSGESEVLEVEDTTPSSELLSEPVTVVQQVDEAVVTKDEGIKPSNPGRMKTRSKRSSQRLTFGEKDESEERTSEMESKSSLRVVDKLNEVKAVEEKDKTEVGGDEDLDDETSSDSEESEEEQEMENEGMDELPKSTETLEKDGDQQKVEGTPIGVVSSGLDIQDTEEDIINSSQSPLKPLGEDDEAEGTSDSPSQRLSFPSLTFADLSNLASPEKPKMTAVATEGGPFQISPIIPTKFTPRVQGSPEGASMRPMWLNPVDSPEGSIPHMYSPTASPSSGILKHRDLVGSSSPSPSSKSRRVSFADKVFIEPEPLQDHSAITKVSKPSDSSVAHALPQEPSRVRLPMSPLVTTASSKVMAHHHKYITTPSKSDSSQSSTSSPSSNTLQRLRRKSPHSSRRMKSKTVKSFPNNKSATYASKVFHMVNQQQADQKKSNAPSQSTQGSLTQGSPSTQVDSSLEAQGESQGSVYPALAECSLPVESVLHRLTSSMWSRGLGQLVRARNIRTIGDLSSLSPMQVQSLPIKSPKVSHLKHILGKFQTEKFPESKGTDIDLLTKTDSGAKADEGSSTPPGRPAGQRSTNVAMEMTSKDSSSLSPPRSPRSTPDANLLGRLTGLVSDFREGALDSLPAIDLFRAHQHVNELTDIIMDALKMKCNSPSMSKDN